MSRSNWKVIVEKKILRKKNELFINRNETINPLLFGKTFNVHNGKNWEELKIETEMNGYKVGEFITTKFVPIKSNLKKRSKKSKKK